jgi:hypothetical protein
MLVQMLPNCDQIPESHVPGLNFLLRFKAVC